MKNIIILISILCFVNLAALSQIDTIRLDRFEIFSLIKSQDYNSNTLYIHDAIETKKTKSYVGYKHIGENIWLRVVYIDLGNQDEEHYCQMTFENDTLIENGVSYSKLCGQIQYIAFVKNGDLEGQLIEFNENQTILAITEYSQNKKNGLAVEYFESGKIKSKGYYQNSQRTGFWEFYYEDGTLESHGNLKLVDGLIECCSQYEGARIFDYGFTISVPLGCWEYYDSGGNLIAIRYFE